MKSAGVVAVLIVVASIISLVGHLAWAIGHASPAALQRGGASLIFFGLLLAGLPYLDPKTIQVQAADRMPPLTGAFMTGDNPERAAKREAKRPAAIVSVILERFVAFALIAVGTIINGYGDWFLGAKF